MPPDRSPFAGMLAIARFNWPFYLAAVLVMSTAIILLVRGGSWSWLAVPVLFGSLWFLLGSLGASHWVYDRSPLYRWDWLPDAWGETAPTVAAVCISGFDEVSGPLARRHPGVRFTVLDHYDPERLTEASIHRARRAFPPGRDCLRVPFDHWPPLHFDLVLAPLSIHEFRRETERSAWFTAARAALREGGSIVLVEHVRDLANLVAFGPGFLHFHSASSWRRAWEAAGLEQVRQFRLTPFVRVFVLK